MWYDREALEKYHLCLMGCLPLYIYQQTSSRLDVLCFKDVLQEVTNLICAAAAFIFPTNLSQFTSKPSKKVFFKHPN